MDEMLTIAPGALFFHSREAVLALQKHAFQIDINQAVPVFFADLHGPPRLHNSHVIQQDIDPPIDFLAAANKGLHLCRFRHVGLVNRTEAILLVDKPLRLLGCGPVEVHREDFRSFAGKQYRRGFAVSPSGTAGTGARDDGDFILQAFAHFQPPLRLDLPAREGCLGGEKWKEKEGGAQAPPSWELLLASLFGIPPDGTMQAIEFKDRFHVPQVADGNKAHADHVHQRIPVCPFDEAGRIFQDQR